MESKRSINAVIVHMLNNNTRYSTIQQLLSISSARISNVKKQYLQNGTILPDPIREYKSKVTPEIKSAIADLTFDDPTLSSKKVAQTISKQGLNISESTVWKIRKNLNYMFRPPKIRPRLTELQKRKRVAFAISFLEQIPDDTKIIFSDESSFQLFHNNRWVWSRRGEKNEKCYRELSKHSPSLMVFAAIGQNYKSRLVFIEGTVDTRNYWNILDDAKIKNDLDTLYGQKGYVFQQDGAPAHRSQKTLEYLETQFNLLKNWPSNSPDLSPIENMWGYLKRIVSDQNPKNISELKTLLEKTWNEIDLNIVNKLIFSFKRRLKLCLKHNGDCIQNLLKNEKIFGEDDLLDPKLTSVQRFGDMIQYAMTDSDALEKLKSISNRSDRFSAEDDRLLLDIINQNGPKWSLISTIMQRSASTLKSRYLTVLRKRI